MTFDHGDLDDVGDKVGLQAALGDFQRRAVAERQDQAGLDADDRRRVIARFGPGDEAVGDDRQRLGAAMKGWRSALAKMVRDAQEAGEVRQDMDAAVLAGLIWDVWEGAILRMKVEQSTVPLRQSTDLVLNHLLRPQQQT